MRCVLTHGGSQFITPLSVAALSENNVYSDLWSLKDESEMGHIRLSREADLIVIAPASANLMAQMAHGLAEDLASTTLLASNRPIMICPAMNPMMWAHQATQDNLKTLEKRGAHIIMPDEGEMACGETGVGRMSEPESILQAVESHFTSNKPLAGKHAIITSGPTYEALDPVRFIGNRSSGKQGHALARALMDAGARVTLISGPTALPAPDGANTVHIESAEQMLKAVQNALGADIFVAAAAVSDWKASQIDPHKIKKQEGQDTLNITLVKNPDILKEIASVSANDRPALVIGFAAETQNLIENAQAKLKNKNCDWIIANQVGANKAFGKDENQVMLITKDGAKEFEMADKSIIARDITDEIIQYFNSSNNKKIQNA